MSRKVLYRKYRPTKLTEVVGQSQVTDALANSIKQGKIGHAYLFIGPRGTGKTSVARIFAHAVNDFTYNVEDNYLDIIEIDAASNTGVDNIRELREKSVIAPTSGKYKVYIIDEVHMLTKSASNALLKTLEEPPEHVIFIMATTDAHKVPITISSRTQVFTFKLADSATMFDHLKAIASKESIQITDDALKLVVRRGGGSFRDSLSLLDQVATLTDGEITATVLENALGLPQAQLIQNLLSAYSTNDTTSIQSTLKELLNNGIKPEIIASELIERIIEHPEPAYLELLGQLPSVQPPFPEAKLLLALMMHSSTPNTPTIGTPAAAAPNPSHNPAPTPSISTKQSSVPNISVSTSAPTVPNLASATPESASSAANSSTPASAHPSIRDQLIARRKAAEKRARLGITEQPSEPTPPASTEVSALNATFAPVSSDGSFDWTSFLNAIRADNSGLYARLQKIDYEMQDDGLHLYPDHALTKSILEKSNSKQDLARHLGGLEFFIHNVGEKDPPKDETLSQISAIMGDVREVKGDLPF